MTLEEVEKYFGSLHAVTVKLGIAFQNMTRWRKQGYIPLLQQYRITELTDGELMPDEVDPKSRNYRKKSKQQIGYKIIFANDENADSQLQDVKLDKVFIEQSTGILKERPLLNTCLEYLRNGDTLHIHRMDRLARSLHELQEFINTLIAKGVTVHFHTEHLIFNGSENALTKMMIQLLDTVVKMKSTLRHSRQKECIAYAKRNGTKSGKPFGRQPLDMRLREPAIELCKQGKNISEISRALGISRPSVNKLLA